MMRCSCCHPLPLMPKGERFRWEHALRGEHEWFSSMIKGEIVDWLSLMTTLVTAWWQHPLVGMISWTILWPLQWSQCTQIDIRMMMVMVVMPLELMPLHVPMKKMSWKPLENSLKTLDWILSFDWALVPLEMMWSLVKSTYLMMVPMVAWIEPFPFDWTWSLWWSLWRRWYHLWCIGPFVDIGAMCWSHGPWPIWYMEPLQFMAALVLWWNICGPFEGISNLWKMDVDLC